MPKLKKSNRKRNIKQKVSNLDKELFLVEDKLSGYNSEFEIYKDITIKNNLNNDYTFDLKLLGVFILFLFIIGSSLWFGLNSQEFNWNYKEFNIFDKINNAVTDSITAASIVGSQPLNAPTIIAENNTLPNNTLVNTTEKNSNQLTSSAAKESGLLGISTDINSCRTLGSGSYTITAAYLIAAGTCFYINESNVVLDCNGKQITYPIYSNSGNGINISNGVSNITIKNCKLYLDDSYYDGETWYNSCNGVLECTGIYSLGNNINIYNNTITYGSGAWTSSYGMYLSGNNYNITKNSVGMLWMHNIYLNTNYSLIFNNTLYNGPGIYLADNSNYNNITNNSIKGYLDSIIKIMNSKYNLINNNIINLTSGTYSSIALYSSNYTRIENNTLESYNGYVINLSGGSQYNNFTNNDIVQKSSTGNVPGIIISGTPSLHPDNNRFVNNRINSSMLVIFYHIIKV